MNEVHCLTTYDKFTHDSPGWLHLGTVGQIKSRSFKLTNGDASLALHRGKSGASGVRTRVS